MKDFLFNCWKDFIGLPNQKRINKFYEITSLAAAYFVKLTAAKIFGYFPLVKFHEENGVTLYILFL